MKSKKINEFLAFKFENNVSWQEFSQTLDAGISQNELLVKKLAWYRENIDPIPIIRTLRMTPKLIVTTNFDQMQKKLPTKKLLENWLKLGYIFTGLLSLRIANSIAYTVCLLAIFRQLKRPRWTKQYGQKLFENEFAHNILYLLVFFFFPNQNNFLYSTPLVIHFWVGLAEYFFLTKGFEQRINLVRQKKDKLIDLKCLLEIILFVVGVALFLFGMGNFFFLLFYFNFLRIKCVINKKTQAQFSKINSAYIEKVKTSSKCPRVISYLIGKLQQFGRYLVKIK